MNHIKKKKWTHTLTHTHSDICWYQSDKILHMLRAMETSYSPKAVTDVVIIIKGKERKKKTRTSNCQGFRRRFLKISGGLWGAVGSTASAGCSSEEAHSALHTQHCAMLRAQWVALRLHKPLCIPWNCSCWSAWKQRLQTCLGIFSAVSSQKVLAQHRSGQILSDNV